MKTENKIDQENEDFEKSFWVFRRYIIEKEGVF